MNFCAAIIDAVADHRPAVILALADDVDLVAAARAVFDLPEIAGSRVDRETLLIAVAVAPDFRLRVGAADKWIVCRRRAVGRDPDQLAEMIGKVLRLVAMAEMFAQRDKQIAVTCLHDAAAVVIARRQRSFLAEDDFDIVKPAIGVVQFCPRYRGTAAATGSLGKAEINGVVLPIGFIEHDVEQSALA